MNQIFAQLFYEMEKHRDTVLVTLIDAAGSAPRKSGPMTRSIWWVPATAAAVSGIRRPLTGWGRRC